MNPAVEDRTQPFVGSQALAAGVLNTHQLRARYQAVLPNVYVERGREPSLQDRIAGQALPFRNIQWDMSTCHTRYIVPFGKGNVRMVDLKGNPLDSFIYAGDPPARADACTAPAREAAGHTVLEPARSADQN